MRESNMSPRPCYSELILGYRLAGPFSLRVFWQILEPADPLMNSRTGSKTISRKDPFLMLSLWKSTVYLSILHYSSLVHVWKLRNQKASYSLLLEESELRSSNNLRIFSLRPLNGPGSPLIRTIPSHITNPHLTTDSTTLFQTEWQTLED